MSYPERIQEYFVQDPIIAQSSYIAPNATVTGAVTLGEESSVWYQCVLRADINQIVIGAHSNIQDGTVIHLESNTGTYVGKWVTVGHRAILHACTIEDEVLVGMGAIIMDGAVIGTRSIIGAGAVVTGGTRIPPGSLVLGTPAKVVRALSETEQIGVKGWAERYVILSRAYMERAAH